MSRVQPAISDNGMPVSPFAMLAVLFEGVEPGMEPINPTAGEPGSSESAVMNLWAKGGVKVRPGKPLARDGADDTNPGEGFIRVALAADLETTKEALRRIAVALT